MGKLNGATNKMGKKAAEMPQKRTAHIRHFWRTERCYEECNDRGTSFYDWTMKEVEHFCCSACGGEISRGISFCPHCGVKMSGRTEEEYLEAVCAICGKKFTQMHYAGDRCCVACRDIFSRKTEKWDIAKAFYELGRKEGAAGK